MPTARPVFRCAGRVLATSATLGLLSFAAISSGARGLPAQQGILNFDKVSDQLYRGAEPDATAMKNLRQLGIKSIIDLRIGKEVRKSEAAEAQSGGITYTNFPLNGVSRPTDEQVRTTLSLIDTMPGPVFIHCRHGCDRTGTVVACYRIKHDRWTGENAMQEALRHGISWLEFGMKRFIADFSKISTQVAKN